MFSYASSMYINSSSSSDSTSSNLSIVIGAAVGGTATLCLVVTIIWTFRKRTRKTIPEQSAASLVIVHDSPVEGLSRVRT
jgi:hypothetical protein